MADVCCAYGEEIAVVEPVADEKLTLPKCPMEGFMDSTLTPLSKPEADCDFPVNLEPYLEKRIG